MNSETFEPIASHALSVYPALNAPKFESSKPPPEFPSQGYLRNKLASVYLFIIHPSLRTTSHGVARHVKAEPEMWYISITKKSIEVGRGRPPSSLFGRRRRSSEIVIECSTSFPSYLGDRDLVDLATGKVRAQTLYESGRVTVRGKLDKALKISRLLAHERSKLYRVVTNDPAPDAESELSFDERLHDYSIATPGRARL